MATLRTIGFVLIVVTLLYSVFPLSSSRSILSSSARLRGSTLQPHLVIQESRNDINPVSVPERQRKRFVAIGDIVSLLLNPSLSQCRMTLMAPLTTDSTATYLIYSEYCAFLNSSIHKGDGWAERTSWFRPGISSIEEQIQYNCIGIS
jgi:hypothetical protein